MDESCKRHRVDQSCKRREFKASKRCETASSFWDRIGRLCDFLPRFHTRLSRQPTMVAETVRPCHRVHLEKVQVAGRVCRGFLTAIHRLLSITMHDRIEPVCLISPATTSGAQLRGLQHWRFKEKEHNVFYIDT